MQYPPSVSETGMSREDRNVFKGVDDLLPDVKYLLPKCDAEITIRKTLSEITQQFCRHTGALQTVLEVTVAGVNTTRYELPLSDTNSDLFYVREIGVWRIPAGGTSSTATFSRTLYPHQYSVEDPLEEDSVFLNLESSISVPTDGSTIILRISVALIPLFDQSVGENAYSLPDKFLRRWRQGIVSGAVARLAAMKKKPWYDDGLAFDMSKLYDSIESEAKDKASFNRMAEGSSLCVNRIGFV